jgi:hypothetical protein
MARPETEELRDELRHYGVSPERESVKFFSGGPRPELVEYLDLVAPRKEGELSPNGVAESQGKPLLYFVNRSRLAEPQAQCDEQLSRLRRALGCRGQRAYLAVVKPGQLEVVPVSLDERTPERREYRRGSGEAVTFFSRLALGHYDGKGEPAQADYAFHGMLKLLTEAGKRLADPPYSLNKLDVLSLIGRALFFRFLCDRQIVTPDYAASIAPKAADLFACFDTAENAAATCKWLDKTFNGDFLPLADDGSAAFFAKAAEHSNGRVFLHLGAIMRGYEAVPGGYQTHFSIDWSDFDFAHVPVGLLSQVYEKFCWKWDPATAHSTSVHYTPRNIAAVLVGEVFDNLPNAHEARLLDPACGGGVLLVLAFRELYRARWEATKVRPDTRVIREIMHRQLRGFEINESALRLTALSLYLTAIELDPKPIPPSKLKFDVLRERVLFNFWRNGTDPVQGPVIGCLGPHVSGEFNGQFDVVLSNPPWTSLPKKALGIEDETEREKEEKRLAALADEFTKVSQGVIRRKNEPELARKYRNPDKAPDLPILWRSTEWCKPGGRIAMALPARILLKQTRTGRQARETLLQLVEVTGIVNGSNLSDTSVWPEMGQPFLLLFAGNKRPTSTSAIKFISPHCDVSLNRHGEVRIDSKSVQPVEPDEAREVPWLWKALAIGTQLDVEVVRKLEATNGLPVGKYWGKKRLGLPSSVGYILGGKESKQWPAPFLRHLPNLDSTGAFRFAVNASALVEFGRGTAHRPRKPAVYRAPLVLVKESPGIDRDNGWALLSLADLAYNVSFYGYSTSGHPDAELLARYFHLFTNSRIWIYYALVTSPKFGAERRRFYKGVLDACPIVPFGRLGDEHKGTILELSARLVRQESGVFAQIDTFFAELHGLDRLDLQVISDTLDVCLPYDQSRQRACQAATGKEQERFRRRIERLLKPFFEVVGERPQVVLWRPEGVGPRTDLTFGVLLIGERGRPVAKPDDFFRDRIVPLANETGASQIIQRIEGGLLVAILNQYRYWTPSRARLCAAGILRSHMDAFGG